MIEKYLSLYIHIPFCIRKCNYCDFLSAPADEETKETYIQALLLEIESYRESELSQRKIATVFFGGGTPSVLAADQITRILDKIKSVFELLPDCEITLEMNPGTVTKEKCKCYYNAGVNRVSIGLQSPDDALLQTLGRIHTYEQFLQTYDDVRVSGIQNVNVDLMSALPGQDLQGYCEGIRKVTRLSPEHISAYSLIIEEGTPFYDKYKNECNLFPDEQMDRIMYEQTKKILQEFGYERYEISNYARPGYECKHNMVYWKCEDYLGLGLGSSSLINNARFKNACDLKEYIRAWKTEDGISAQGFEREELTRRMQMEEFMFMGLRMMRGVSERRFEEKFGDTVRQIYRRQLDRLTEEKLLYKYEKTDGVYWALTDKGIDVSNYVFEQFLF
jgi:oxygen-independent coproporphyrinogen-3 oxidase